MAEAPLREAIQGKDVEVEWMPFELRPEPTPTLKPEEEYLQTTWRENVLPLAERMGVQMVLPRVSPQPHTHLAFEGYQYAKEQGRGNAYNARLLAAFFQEEQDIGDIEVLTRLAGEIGLNQSEYRQALETRQYREAHQKALHHAYNEAKINVVPTLYIGNRKLPGLYLRPQLERVIEEELQAQRFEAEDAAEDGL